MLGSSSSLSYRDSDVSDLMMSGRADGLAELKTKMRSTAVRILVLGNGAAGAEKQGLALAARLQQHLARASPEVAHDGGATLLRVPMNEWSLLSRVPPVAQLAAARILGDPFAGYDVSAAQRTQFEQLRSAEDSIAVVIGCGRTTVSLCASMRMTWAQPTAFQRAANRVFNIQIQHPRTPLSLFDAVITPQHDVSHGASVPDNLLLTTGTVSMLDANEVAEEGHKWEAALKSYLHGKDRRVVWLVGGPCRGFDFDTRVVEEMTASVLNLVRGQDHSTASLLVTFSRRTPDAAKRLIEERLTSELDASHELFIWNGEGLNPYLGLLHHASVIVTTPDSVSMTTEAILSGKQVCTVGAEHMKGKFRRFHDTLQARGDVIPLRMSGTMMHSSGSIGSSDIERELDAIAGDLVHKILERINCPVV